MKMKILLLIIFSCAVELSFGQNVLIDRIDIRGNKIIVWYNLSDQNTSRKYSISLYSSKDKFTSPLMNVSGDVGLGVTPGIDKKIAWDITNELGNYKGAITLEIRGSLSAPFIHLTNSNIRKSYNRGKKYYITWASGDLAGQVNIELYKDKELIWDANNLPNLGKYSWTVPKTLKKGTNYQLKILNAKDPNDFRYSNTFEIKPRTPFILKAGVVVLLGAGVAVLGGGSKGSASSSNDLPNPPATPGN